MGWPLNKPRKNIDVVKLDEETGCWLWSGTCDCYGHPVRFEKGRTIRIRSQQFERKFGRKARGFKPNSCGRQNCINPDHFVERGHTQGSLAQVKRITLRQAELSEVLERWKLTVSVLEQEQDKDAVETRNSLAIKIVEAEKELAQLDKELEQFTVKPMSQATELGEEKTNEEPK